MWSSWNGTKNGLLGIVWPIARDKEVTPSTQNKISLYSIGDILWRWHVALFLRIFLLSDKNVYSFMLWATLRRTLRKNPVAFVLSVTAQNLTDHSEESDKLHLKGWRIPLKGQSCHNIGLLVRFCKIKYTVCVLYIGQPMVFQFCTS
jgi:hypothetical protein